MHHMRRSPLPLIAPAAALIALGCPTTAPVLRDATLTGAWGGDHASLTLTDHGGAVEYDCAHGSVTESMRTDGAGRFTAAGFHVREHGGPVREGEPVDSAAATYTGRVAGDRMTLTVRVGADSLGPFTLVRGASPRLYKCL
jgi:hypothetical protein